MYLNKVLIGVLLQLKSTKECIHLIGFRDFDLNVLGHSEEKARICLRVCCSGENLKNLVPLLRL